MKKTPTIAITPASLPPLVITSRMTIRNHRRPLKNSGTQSVPSVQPPTEETINQLNGIGREYPFCVYYKGKRYDPL